MFTTMRCPIKLHHAIVILGLIQITAGCKKAKPEDSKSDSKNIEVAAEGTNEATISEDKQPAKIEYCLEDKGSDADTVAKAILSKLPARLAKEYEKVKVTLISDVDKIHAKCLEVNDKTSALKASSGEKYVACWGPTSKTELVDIRPEIFLLNDIDTIHSNLIAMVISSYAELYIDQIMPIFVKASDGLKADDPAKKDLDTALKGFVDFKANRKVLASKFAKFLDASPDKDVAGNYKAKFLGDTKASDDKLISDVGFQNFVLAETGESAFCSKKTLSVLKEEKYKDVMKAFEPFEAFFTTVQ